jgi:hypothetical protein
MTDAFSNEASEGQIDAAALAANVAIPTAYSPPYPDGLRVHLESQDSARFIYVPYRLARQGLLRRTMKAELQEPIAVQIAPVFFAGRGRS